MKTHSGMNREELNEMIDDYKLKVQSGEFTNTDPIIVICLETYKSLTKCSYNLYKRKFGTKNAKRKFSKLKHFLK